MKTRLFLLLCCFFSLNFSFIYCEDSINALQDEQIVANETNSMPISPPEYKGTVLKMLLILLALIVMVFLTLWIFKKLIHIRTHQANLTKSIKILEKRSLSPKSMLYLVEIDNKKVLLSESHLEVRRIKELN